MTESPIPAPGRGSRMLISSPSSDRDLVVVHARQIINPILAGHEGGEYTSPPQPREQALALVAMLLGAPAAARDGEHVSEWSCPIAGGRLTITLQPSG